MNCRRSLLIGFLILLLPACQGPGDGRLTVVFPTETTKRIGGQLLRVTISLVDHDGQPVEGASAQAELRAPNGDVFATLPCADQGQGHYLADYARLPLRGTEGTWRVVARATWGDNKQAQAERTFEGLPSISEQLYKQYGFWVEPPHFFEYSPTHPANPHFEDWPYEDGGRYVLLENNRHTSSSLDVTASLDVHWRQTDFPTDEGAAVAYVQGLAGLYYENPDAPYTNLVAEPTTFQGQSAWRVTGQWRSAHTHRAPAFGGPVEWTIFRCPGSDWLWTLVIYTNDAAYMDDLRTLREKFECPTP